MEKSIIVYRGIEIEIEKLPKSKLPFWSTKDDGYRYTYEMLDKDGNAFTQTWDALTYAGAIRTAQNQIDVNFASDTGRAFN